MTRIEYETTTEALMGWFEDQQIEACDACWISATLCGLLAPDGKRVAMLVRRMRDVSESIQTMKVEQ